MSLGQPHNKNTALISVFRYSVYSLALTIPISIAVSQIVAALLIIESLFLFGFRKIEGLTRIMAFCIAFFIAIILISTILSPDISESIPQIKKFWVIICFFPLAFFYSLYDRKIAIDFLIAGTGIASAIALARYVLGSVDRAAPFSGGYTTIAVFAAAVIPFVILKIYENRNRKGLLYAASGIIIGMALIFSKTRGGWLAALAAALIMGFAIDKKKTLILLSLFVVLIAAVPVSRHVITERIHFGDKGGGITTGRTLLYKSAINPIKNLPFFGYGPGSFRRLVPESILEEIGDTGIRSWHSTPLEILMESGPLALLLLIISSILPLRGLFGAIYGRAKGNFAVWACISSMVALYIAGMTTNLLRDFLSLALLTMIWALSVTWEGGPKLTGN